MTLADRDDQPDLQQARAALVQRRLRAAAGRNAGRGIRPRVTEGPVALSPTQRQLWYLSQFPGSLAYNEAVRLTRTGPLDHAAAERAINDFVARHEAWRTTFPVIDAEPRQVVQPPARIDLPLIDLSALPYDEATARATDLMSAEARRPYNLGTGPLFRPYLVRISADEHRLYLAMHHIIFDGVTLVHVLLPEFNALYDGRPLPPVAVQYPDYAEWEERWAGSEEFAARLDWWRRRLVGDEPCDLALPLDRPRPAQPTSLGHTAVLDVPRNTVAGIRAVAADAGVSFFHIAAAGYARLLAEFTGQHEVSFGTFTDMRRRPELAGLAGYCLAPVVLRVNHPALRAGGPGGSSGSLELPGLLRAVRDEVIDAIDHAVPFEPLVRSVRNAGDAAAHGDPRANPLFQAAFVLEPSVRDRSGSGSWTLQLHDSGLVSGLDTAKFDLSVTLDERPDGGVTGTLTHSTDVLTPETGEQLAERLGELFAGLGGRPVTRLVAPPDARTPTEHHTSAQDAAMTLPALVLQRATERPDAVAVVGGGSQLTYRDLVDRACRVAAQLSRLGAGRETVVATVLDRSPDMVAGLLGVLLSGAAYLPLDARQPRDRLAFMVQDAQALCVLATSGEASRASELGLPVVPLDDAVSAAADAADRATTSATASAADSAPAGGATLVTSEPGDLAYIIYTSGSTGRPKGVLVEHRNLVHLASTLFPALGLGDADTLVTVASYTFDMSVGDIFSALATGTRLVVADAGQVADPRALSALLETSGATAMRATPTTWSALIAAGWPGRPGFTAVCGGEPLPEPLAGQLVRRCGRVLNGYGPTETTVVAACGPVDAESPINVGFALPGTTISVVDEAGLPVPDGMVGEVVIGGRGVARGYLNRPEEDADRFVPDTDNRGDAGGTDGTDRRRRYRSGDRGRLLADGRLRLLGRIDGQVKVRGFRIEPGEIESVLRDAPGVRSAAVIARPVRDDSPELVAFVVGATADPDEQVLRRTLRARLPEYMVPGVIVTLPELPVTSSGKLDRGALATAPIGPARTTGRPPSGELECRLAELWSDLLGEPVRDADADFFDIGGHSLLAARLVARLETEAGQPVSLGDFIASGRTIHGLARLLEHGPAEQDVPELTVVFPDAVNAMSARYFGDRPIRTVIPQQVDGLFDQAGSVEQLASRSVEALTAEQPHGAFALAGYSFGGLLAYEIARQLLERGREVAWIGLLDSNAPTMADHSYWLQFTLAGRWHGAKRFDRRERWRRYRNAAASVVLRRPAEMAETFDYRGALALTRRYTAPPLELAIDLFLTDDSAAYIGDATLGWRDYHRGEIRLHRLDGRHADLLRPPQVHQVIAAVLREFDAARA